MFPCESYSWVVVCGGDCLFGRSSSPCLRLLLRHPNHRSRRKHQQEKQRTMMLLTIHAGKKKTFERSASRLFNLAAFLHRYTHIYILASTILYYLYHYYLYTGDHQLHARCWICYNRIRFTRKHLYCTSLPNISYSTNHPICAWMVGILPLCTSYSRTGTHRRRCYCSNSSSTATIKMMRVVVVIRIVLCSNNNK